MLKNKNKELRTLVIKKIAQHKQISILDAEVIFNSLSQKKKRKLISNPNNLEV